MERHSSLGDAAYGLRAAFDAERAMDRAASARSPKPDVPEHCAKVREIIFHDGIVYKKYALIWNSGTWVCVREGEEYPSGCIREIESECCERWRDQLVKSETLPGGTLCMRIPYGALVCGIKFCPECGRKLGGNK